MAAIVQSVSLTSCQKKLLAVPHDSLTGALLLRMYEVAFCTDSVFKKYFLVPLVIACALPFTALLDCCFEVIKFMGHRGKDCRSFLEDMAAHIISVVALPFRLVSYLGRCQITLFSVRDSKTYSSVYIRVKQFSNPRFAAEFFKRNRLSEAEQNQLSRCQRIQYKIALADGKLPSPAEFLFPKGAFEFALKKNDTSLLEDIITEYPGEIFNTFITSCVRLGSDPAIAEPTRRRYREQAVILLRRNERNGLEEMEWLGAAISSDQTVLVQEAFRLGYRFVFSRKLDQLITKTMRGEADYQDIIQHAQYALSSEQRNDLFSKWLDDPVCLNHLDIMKRLFSGQGTWRGWSEREKNFLNRAMKLRSVELVEHLLQFFPPSQTDVQRVSALEYAFSDPVNRLQLIKLLILKGLKSNEKFSHFPPLKGHTPLTFAAEIGDIGLIKLFNTPENRKEVSHHPNFFGQTPFNIAASQRHISAKLLLKEEPSKSGFDEEPPKSRFDTSYFKPEFFGWRFPRSFRLYGDQEEKVAPQKATSEVISKCLEESEPRRDKLKEIKENLREASNKKNLWLAFGSSQKMEKVALLKKFRELSLICHPDKNEGERKVAEGIFKALGAIKDQLNNSFYGEGV